MHVERNVSSNILKHIMGEKDTPAGRRDMEEAGVFPHLWLQREGDVGDYIMPRAPWVFSAQEKAAFLRTVSQTRVPSGYSSTLTKHVGELKLAGLKSHDHHCLLQQVLPVAIRHSLGRGPPLAIIGMVDLFHRICSKVLNPAEMQDLKTFAAEILCLFELHFPPGFFDVMSHLVIHLVQELELCGPVHGRWCYGIERYLGVLTSYVRDRSKPEASMASGYVVDEALGFCTEYFSLYAHTRRRIWDPEQELRESGEVLMGRGTQYSLSDLEISQIHEYVLRHSVHSAKLYQ